MLLLSVSGANSARNTTRRDAFGRRRMNSSKVFHVQPLPVFHPLCQGGRRPRVLLTQNRGWHGAALAVFVSGRLIGSPVSKPPVFYPSRRVAPIGIAMGPVDNSALTVPFILAVEFHTVSRFQCLDPLGQVDVMRDQKRLPIAIRLPPEAVRRKCCSGVIGAC